MPLSHWQRQSAHFRRYALYAFLIAPVGFVLNVATTVTASPLVILMHALVMLVIAPFALTLAHALVETPLVALDRMPEAGHATEVGMRIVCQTLGMTATLFLTVAVLETFTELRHLLAGPLISACALVLAFLVILTLFDAFRSREMQLLKLKTLQAEARYQSLNEQLKPHFLYNTLNVLAEVVHQDPKAGSDGIVALARLYQAIVDLSAEQKIALADELEIVEKYLSLQRLRFGARLTVEILVDPAARSLAVPPLGVFNLVENAVKYGVGKVTGAGRLTIEVKSEGTEWSLKVINRPASMASPGRAGTGLANVRHRLALLYGKNASLGLAVDSEQASAELRLPRSGA